METIPDIRELVRQSGRKQQWIAAMLHIRPETLSRALRGKQPLAPARFAKLRELLAADRTQSSHLFLDD